MTELQADSKRRGKYFCLLHKNEVPRLSKHRSHYIVFLVHPTSDLHPSRFWAAFPSPGHSAGHGPALTDEDGGVEAAEPGQQRAAGCGDGQGAALHVCGRNGALGLRARGRRLEPLGRRSLTVPSHGPSLSRPVPSRPAGAVPGLRPLPARRGRAPQAPWRGDDVMARRCAEHPGSCSPATAAAICSARGPEKNHGAQRAAKCSQGGQRAGCRQGRDMFPFRTCPTNKLQGGSQTLN